MSNSYTPPDRSTYDPGWNDPPAMPSMTAPAPVAAKPRTNLNKRVAFPMQSSTVTSSNVKTTAEGLPLPFSTAKYQPPTVTGPTPEVTSTSQPVLPPPPSSTILNPSVPCQPNSTQPELESVSETFDSMTAKDFSISVFNGLVDAMAANTDAGKISEIRKRIDAMDQMWQQSKFDESAQKKLYQLAKALENKDTSTAMEQHRLLVTQHINVTTQWATALRQIILSTSSELQSDAENVPTELSETEVVQFVDVSTKPTVLNSIPSIPQNIIDQGPATLPISNDNDSIPSANIVQSNNETEPKSRFGRFGRILHI